MQKIYIDGLEIKYLFSISPDKMFAYYCMHDGTMRKVLYSDTISGKDEIYISSLRIFT